ncbi:MAG TPA: anti-sigma F factor antagonist [Clostridiales bacterium]|nr:anti-sigma F factor antagonist [Clostridiales bacterium]
MDIRTERVGDILVVRVSGELDLATAGEFRHRVDADLDRFGSRDVVIDFSELGFLDSSGLGALLGRYKRVAERGGRVAVSGCAPHVRRVLELSGVMRIIECHPSVREAVAAFGGDTSSASGGGVL